MLHYVGSISFFAARKVDLSGISVVGQRFLSPFAITFLVMKMLFAALEHLDRVRHINLTIENSQLGKAAAAVQGPFPVLTYLHIFAMVGVPVPPSGFSSGSAPCLQQVYFYAISFPELPSFLLSSRDLVYLCLDCIPRTGYISPEAMVGCLAVLPRLVTFYWIPMGGFPH